MEIGCTSSDMFEYIKGIAEQECDELCIKSWYDVEEYYSKESLLATIVFNALHITEGYIAEYEMMDFNEKGCHVSTVKTHHDNKDRSDAQTEVGYERALVRSVKNYAIETLGSRKSDSEAYFGIELEDADFMKQQPMITYLMMRKKHNPINIFVTRECTKLTKKQFEDLSKYYEDVMSLTESEHNCGYLKFKHLYLFEFDTHIEMMYKYLQLIKLYKRSYTLSDKAVNEELRKLALLHLADRPDSNYYAKMINYVCFDIEKLVHIYDYKKRDDSLSLEDIYEIFSELSKIIVICSVKTSIKFRERYEEIFGVKINYATFYKVTNSKKADDYFCDYLKRHKHYEAKKTDTITFQHLKMIYKLKEA